LIILPPNNAPIIIGELQAMIDWNARKEKKYKEQLVPKINRPASVLAFEVGQLGEPTHLPRKFLDQGRDSAKH
jgi:hypothetical protein